MPDIIDLSTVEIYEDVEEIERLQNRSERRIELAAQALVQRKEDTLRRNTVQVSHISDNLSNFMSDFATSVTNEARSEFTTSADNMERGSGEEKV